MAFKMRSGNKISFKNMGSSPAKQAIVPGTELVTPGELEADVFSDTQEQIKLLNLQNKERKRKELEAKRKVEKPTVKKLRDISIKEEQLKSGDVLSESSSAPEGDSDVNQYKSKEQLRQDRKTRKLESKTNIGKGSTEDRKIFGIKVGTKQYTKAERAADKDAYLANRLQREKGTGENVYSFNWKDALLGDSIASGLTYGAKHKKTQKKIDKRAEKVAKAKTRASGKAKRKAIRDAAKK